MPLGEWALQEACRQAAKWPDEMSVAVNLSPLQFASPGLAFMVERILEETKLAPHRLELEITEGLLMRNTQATIETLHGLKKIGLRIAMDDFGTGYSSLSYLQSFPFDRIGSVRVDHGRAGLAVLREARRMTSDDRGGQDNANGGIPEAAG